MLAIPFVVAACGGGGSSNSNSDPTSENYDPAHTTLKDAGLEVCGDANTQVPQNLRQRLRVPEFARVLRRERLHGQRDVA